MNMQSRYTLPTIISLFVLSFLVIMWSESLVSAPSPAGERVLPPNPTDQGYYDSLETIADSLIRKSGQPRSASAVLRQIVERAKQQSHIDWEIKARLRLTTLGQSYSEAPRTAVLDTLRSMIATAQLPGKNILQSTYAAALMQHYYNNAWTIRARTQIASDTAADVETWTATRFYQEAYKFHQLALQDSSELLGITARDLLAVVDSVEDGNVRRPTLFDILANHKIDFLQRSVHNRQDFQIKVSPTNPVVLAGRDEFLAAQLPGGTPFDDIMRLYQFLMRKHAASCAPCVDAYDLLRVRKAHEFLVHDRKDTLYIERLAELGAKAESYAGSIALADLAEFYRDYRQDYVAAVKLCERVVEFMPASAGAARCRSILRHIKRREFNLALPYQIEPGKAFPLKVTYQNLDSLYARILQLNFAEMKSFLARTNNRPIRKGNTIRSWTIALVDFKDYKQHSLETVVDALPLGAYVVEVSERSDFDPDSSLVMQNAFFASRLSSIQLGAKESPGILRTVDAATGTAVADVFCELFKYEYDNVARRSLPQRVLNAVSNRQGEIDLRSLAMNNSYGLDLFKGADSITYGDRTIFGGREYREAKEFVRTNLYTDRSIYRPGQAIYFKGISFVHNRAKGDKHAASDRSETIKFSDVNGREIAALDLKTNQFGSFSGSFIAPSGLTGYHYLRTQHGNVSFRVEEYKRPRFEVVFPPNDSTWRLNSPVLVTGYARGLAAYDVADAQVSYSVTRMPRWNHWGRSSYGRGGFPVQREVVLTAGTTRTDSTGKFTIEFNAAAPQGLIKADPQISYSYRVEVDVTDAAGETRSKETNLVIAARALVLSAAHPDDVNIDNFKKLNIATRNLQGRPVAVPGTVILEQLNTPARPTLAALWEVADTSLLTAQEFKQEIPDLAYLDELDPATWSVAREIVNQAFASDSSGFAALDLPALQPGVYRVRMFARDKYEREVESQKILTVYDMRASSVLAFQPFEAHIESSSLELGDTLRVSVGTAAQSMPLVLRICYRDEILLQRDLLLNAEQELIEFPILAEHRGGLQVKLTAIHNYRSYNLNENVNVEWTNKRLNLKLASYRDKTRPGAAEEWRLTIAGPDGDEVAAELLASMYDASLNEFNWHAWNSLGPASPGESVFNWRQLPSSVNLALNPQNFKVANERRYFFGDNGRPVEYQPLPFDRFADLLGLPHGHYGLARGNTAFAVEMEESLSLSAPAISNQALGRSADVIAGAKTRPQSIASTDFTDGSLKDEESDEANVQAADSQGPSMTRPKRVRRDFRETAFFMPQVATNDQGEFVLRFSMPDALTRWRFMALAHTAQMQGAYLETEVVTQKELMLLPNMPRFLRAGDEIELPVQVRNMLNTTAVATARLKLTDALTGEDLSNIILGENDRRFNLAANSAESVAWRIKVPQDVELLTYYLETSSQDFSDAEENIIPVLPNRRLVTETLAMSVRPGQRKTFKMTNLLDSDESATLEHNNLSFELTQNPTWFVVQALPYLIEYPYDCSEQIYSRLFANALAGKILADNPRIKQVLEQWRRRGALKSPLERNQDLKAILLEATPWLFDGLNQTEQMQRIALLLEVQQLRDGLLSTAAKLEERQMPGGAWPWFAGGRSDTYITAYITSGLGQLLSMRAIDDNLTRNKVRNMYRAGLRYLDGEYQRRYNTIRKRKNFNPQDDYLSPGAAQYLYARSFNETVAPQAEYKEAFEFWLQQSQQHWLKQSVMTQTMLAMFLHRYGAESGAENIVKSLRERAVRSDEFGMYWKNQRGWLWYNSGIETQAMAIEMFREVADDSDAVAELQMWLLQRKRSTHWGNTRATALACFAILQRGDKMLIEQGEAQVNIGGLALQTDQASGELAGLGYLRTNWSPKEISAGQGEVEIKNKGKTLNWAGLYWQYYEDLDKIPAADDGPLSVQKRIFVRTKTSDGEALRPLDTTTPLQVGQRLTIRLEVRCDREMEYLHLQDMRGAGFEPRDVLSGYRWQAGLSYYMSVRDASVNFFFDRMRPGTYVLEYDLYVAHRGSFANGISTIQSMYAPEFAGHTGGQVLQVR